MDVVDWKKSKPFIQVQPYAVRETDEGQPLPHGTNCLRFDMLTVAETAVLLEICTSFVSS